VGGRQAADCEYVRAATFPIRSAMAAGVHLLITPGIAHAGATYCDAEPLEAAN